MIDVVYQAVDGGDVEALGVLADELVHLERRLTGTAAMARPDRVGLRLQPTPHLLVLVPEVLVQEDRIEVDSHHAAVPSDGTQLLVAQVARVVRQGPARRVRRDHRSRAGGQDVPERRVGHVRDIHQHSQLVHSSHHLASEGGEPAVPLGIGGRARPVVPVVPRERHVAHPEPVQRVEVLERVLYRMPTLDAHERRDVAPRRGSPDLIGRGGELHLVVGVRERPHGSDQVEGASKGSAPGVTGIHPDREERGRETTLAHARNIDVPVAQPTGDVGLHVEHPLRRVDVAVHDDRLLEHQQQS